MVCWQTQRNPLLRLNRRLKIKPKLELILENGDAKELPLRTSNKTQLQLPQLPTGYHRLRYENEQGCGETLLISAPQKIFTPGKDLFQWGAFLPMYAAHSAESWGAGNFSDWKKLGNWLASKGGRVMATLPILSAFLGSPIVEPSPYSPASRLFWNEFMIDISAIPEFKTSSAAKKVISSSSFRKSLNQLRSSTLVDYPEAWAMRRKVLEVLAREFFNSSRHRELEDYLKKNPETKDYAAFRAACDHLKTSWQGWPAAAKNGKLDPRVSPKDLQQFYLYIQWIAQLQMDDLLASFRSDEIRFYLDLPLGVNPDSYDAWRYREFFANGASAGAPPDSFFTKGQDWGFAPLHPLRIRQQHYKYVIDYLRFQMRHTGMLRIDHVMGLHSPLLGAARVSG